MLRSTALAAILFALPLAPAMAQNTSTAAQPAKISAAGEWNGKLTTPLRTSHLGVSIKETAPGQLTGTIGSHESGVWGTALADITRAGDALSFRVPTTNGKFDGKWDPAASAWTGTYTNPAGTFPLTLAQGPVPPLPTITALNGRWEGALSVGIELKIVLRTKTDEHGTSMLMDSPTQGANGIPVAKLAKDAQAVAFEVPSIRGRYTGTLSEDGATLTGTWNQAMDMPLTLTRVSMDASVPEARRPQTPKAPFPYKVEEVGYDNPKAAGVHLGCTLTTPQTGGPHPAALLITGSGPQDRDETLMGHQIFGVLADHLTRKGIADRLRDRRRSRRRLPAQAARHRPETHRPHRPQRGQRHRPQSRAGQSRRRLPRDDGRPRRQGCRRDDGTAHAYHDGDGPAARAGTDDPHEQQPAAQRCDQWAR